MHPFFTIGHSTRSIEEFAALLQQSDVRHVADVRTVPRSRTNPQFNADTLPASLAPYQLGYDHITELGGLRGRQKLVDDATDALWHNPSFRNYADYAQCDAFRTGLDELLDLGATGRTAIMCAEAVWWRCHRRIIADHLLARGLSVSHIMGTGDVPLATLTPGAVVTGDRVTYPAPAR